MSDLVRRWAICLRRYWMPALLSDEVPEPDSDPVRVRLMGEDLIAFRDTNGQVGLIQNNCPHRGASLFFGRNEEAGLRCVYHGWKFDVDGQCVDMPNEPAESDFRAQVKAVAYPTHESGGIVWTYMGPPKSSLPFRNFGTDELPREQWRASKTLILLQLRAGDGGQSRHRAHLVSAPQPGRRLASGRRHGSPGLLQPGRLHPHQGPEPRAARRGRGHAVRLPLRGHSQHAQWSRPDPHDHLCACR